jgi:HTH-type transcriptional regulator/antitoxin HipB
MRLRSIAAAAAAVRGRRLELGFSQDELARRAGVSRKWVYEFEAGKPAAELGHVLRVCEALGLELDMSPESAREPAPSAGGTFTLDAVLDDYRRG